MYNFEKIICNNFEKFVGNNEKIIEIFFMIIYFSLQASLIYIIQNQIITIIVLIFLFFLFLERISFRVRLDHERKELNKKKRNINFFKNKTELFYQTEIYKLRKEIKKLKNKG